MSRGSDRQRSLVANEMLGVTRTDLQRHDLSIAGRETVQARIDLAPGAVAPWHRHPGEEVIYIIEGTLEYQLEDQAPVTLKAGDVLFVPAGAAHMARNRTSSNGAELATYIVEKGKPLLVPAADVAPWSEPRSSPRRLASLKSQRRSPPTTNGRPRLSSRSRTNPRPSSSSIPRSRLPLPAAQ